MSIKVYDNEKSKNVRSENYNFDFDKKTGFFARWGKTLDEDPQVGLPEIADIEITTICKGPGNKLCNFCYKGNLPKGDNMSIETFEKLLEKFFVKFVNVELEDGTIKKFKETDIISTTRGLIMAKDLLLTDNIL